jgi:hypothetical protein
MNKIDHQKWAKTLLIALINHIKNFQGGDKFITYGSLAKEVDYPEPHTGSFFGKNIGNTLGVMGHFFDGLVIDGETVPLLQALVVNQNTKLPSDGLKEFNQTYPSLSNEKKRDFVYSEYKRIFEFGDRWTKVLSTLCIKKNNTGYSECNKRTSKSHNPYGSEGSPEHKALRDFIANNPSIVDINSSNMKGITEYPLKSGDMIDVVFYTKDSIVGVEVKSLRSGNDDLERGLYQCVKYSSVLEAEKIINKTNYNVCCVLAIEGELTSKLRRVQKNLGIKVYQQISVYKKN